MRPLLACLLTLLYVVSYAQTAGDGSDPPPSTYNKKIVRNRNIDASVEITRFTTAGVPITGTNELFDLRVVIGPDIAYNYQGTDPAWAYGNVVSARLTIKEEERNLTVTPGLSNGLWHVQLSTTWMAFNETPSVKLEATFLLYRPTENSSEQEEITLSVTVNPKVVNRLSTLATRITLVPTPTQANPQLATWQDDITQGQGLIATNTVSAAIAGFARHEPVVANVGDAQTMHKLVASEMPRNLRLGTVFFATTHGAMTGICDSYGHDPATIADHFMEFQSFIRPKIAENPPDDRLVFSDYHLVVLISCQAAGSAESAKGFGIYDSDGHELPNKALVGFEQVVPSPGIANSNYQTDIDSFTSWTNSFIEKVVAGYTIKEAALFADKYHPITFHDGNRPVVKMTHKYRGDVGGRLYGLYGDGLNKEANQTKFKVTV